MKQDTIKELKQEMEQLKGKHGVARQKAIIRNNKRYRKIATIRINRAKGNISQILSKKIKQVSNNNPKKLEKILITIQGQKKNK